MDDLAYARAVKFRRASELLALSRAMAERWRTGRRLPTDADMDEWLLVVTAYENADASYQKAISADPYGWKTCIGCGQLYPGDHLITLGGGGPFCAPCAERVTEALLRPNTADEDAMLEASNARASTWTLTSIFAECPLCKADLRDGVGSRLIAIYSRAEDRTTHYQCPDCLGLIPRSDESPVAAGGVG
jgi:hypothetical protein